MFEKVLKLLCSSEALGYVKSFRIYILCPLLKLLKKFKVFKTYVMHIHRHYSLFELITFSTCFGVNTELRPWTVQELCLWFYINYTSAGSNQQAWYQVVETWGLWTCSSGN
jgi:hypothetical protein